MCPEGVARIRTDEIKSTATTDVFDEYMISGAIKACQQWPLGQLPADYFASIKSQAPVLILSGEIDPVTPPVWGDEIGRHLPNSLHLKMAGIAHGPFPDCAAQIMTRFLETGDLKIADTSCLADLKRQPFIKPSRALPVTFQVSNELANELVGLEQRLLELVAQADRAQLNRFVPDGFQQLGLLDSTKDRQNKAQWIDRAVQVATRVENATFKLERPQVTFFGDVALMNSRWSLEGTLNDRPFASTIAILDVWQKRDGRWDVVQRQVADAAAARD